MAESVLQNRHVPAKAPELLSGASEEGERARNQWFLTAPQTPAEQSP